MSRRILFFIIILATSFIAASAQNLSREDSIWLQRVLDGDTTLQINQETMKAIKEGNLIVPSWMGKPNEQKGVFEIERSIDGAGSRDSIFHREFDPYTMPPAVFALYVLYMDKMDSIYAEQTILLSEKDKAKIKEMLPPGEKTISTYGQTHGGPGGVILKFDANHILSMMFSSAYRNRIHNRKHANAYKNYYDEGNMYNSVKVTERERKKLRDAVNINISKQYKIPGQKINPIDD